MVATSPDRAWGQFRLRHLLILLAATAVAMAAVATFTRDWPPRKQLLFSGGLAALCLAAFLPAGLAAWRRRHVQRRAGPLLRQDSLDHGGVSPWTLRSCCAFTGSVPLGHLVWDWYEYVGFDRFAHGSQPITATVGYGSCVLLIWSAAVLVIWGPTLWSVEFRQRGLVHGAGMRFLRWQDVIRHEWQRGDAPKLQLVLSQSRSVFLPFRPEQVPDVEQVVSRCLTDAKHVFPIEPSR